MRWPCASSAARDPSNCTTWTTETSAMKTTVHFCRSAAVITTESMPHGRRHLTFVDSVVGPRRWRSSPKCRGAAIDDRDRRRACASLPDRSGQVFHSGTPDNRLQLSAGLPDGPPSVHVAECSSSCVGSSLALFDANADTSGPIDPRHSIHAGVGPGWRREPLKVPVYRGAFPLPFGAIQPRSVTRQHPVGPAS